MKKFNSQIYSPLKISNTGWHSRGYIPHFDRGIVTQFVTIRLYDSMPQGLLQRLEVELRSVNRKAESSLRRKEIEKWLDSGIGSCLLKEQVIAREVEQSLLYFHNEKYVLHEWVIMPNHLHILITLLDDVSLAKVMCGLKSYTARRINILLSRSGMFWSRDYFDRYIRDSKHFDLVRAYIRDNPVRAGLCDLQEEWRFSSAYSDWKEGELAVCR